MEKRAYVGIGVDFKKIYKHMIWNNENEYVLCDNNLAGSEFMGNKIISVEEAINKYPEYNYFISTSKYKYEIISQLIGLGVDRDRIFFAAPFLCNKDKVQMRVGEKGGIEIEINGIKALLKNNADEMVFREIFIDECYNISFPCDSVLIDIGMNVGYASLFFASNSKIKEIFGYEPFDENDKN